ncbi:MAG: hypothetical protein H6719_32175 [Sandaracinaceae bacterium]|nr:hypothetical protein [Sandaracinaceae bacterium]
MSMTSRACGALVVGMVALLGSCADEPEPVVRPVVEPAELSPVEVEEPIEVEEAAVVEAETIEAPAEPEPPAAEEAPPRRAIGRRCQADSQCQEGLLCCNSCGANVPTCPEYVCSRPWRGRCVQVPSAPPHRGPEAPRESDL